SILATVARVRAGERDWSYGIAALDLTTGRFTLSETAESGLGPELARMDPREIVVADALFGDPALAPLWREFGPAVTPIAREGLDGASAERRLKQFYGVATLDGFGTFTRAEIAAAAAAIAYVE